jgi:hypothetical protein
VIAKRATGAARAGYRSVASRLGLIPIQRIMRDLERQGMAPTSLRALEVYGQTGDRITRHYGDLVGSLDVWEIDPRHEAALRRNLPRATVVITDSYAEIHRTDRVYDLVVIDNPVWEEEHFRLFPGVFRVLSNDAVLVILTIPEGSPVTRRRYPELFDERHQRRRRAFYETDEPERIPLEHLVRHYAGLAEANGFRVRWHRLVRRIEVDRLIPRRVSLFLLALRLERR